MRAVAELRKHKAVVLIALVMLAAAIVFSATDIRYYVNPDATSYFSIAEKYAHGNLRQAINGYWGPLFSWLLVPFVYLHVDLAVGARVLSTVFSIGAALVAYCFLLRRGVGRLIASLAFTLIAIILVQLSITGPTTPDLLMSFILALFFYSLSELIDRYSYKQAIVVGIIGSLMYFTKSIGLLFFGLVMAALLIGEAWIAKKPISLLITRFLPIIATVLLLIIPFIVLSSLKYHRFTLASSSEYNHRVFGPVQKGIHPISYMGPVVPPNRNAASAWEDPTYMIDFMPKWNPISNSKNFIFYANQIGQNLNSSLSIIYAQGGIICFGALVMLIGGLNKSNKRDYILLSLIAGSVVFGYSLIFMEQRYLDIIPVLTIIGAALWVGELSRRKIINKNQLLGGGLIVVGLLLLGAGQASVSSYKTDIKDWETLHRQTLSFKTLVPVGANVMTDHDNYYTCYYLKLRCFGVLQSVPGEFNANYYKWLKDTKVRYFIDYHNRDNDMPLRRFIEQYFVKVGDTNATETKVSIYKIK